MFEKKDNKKSQKIREKKNLAIIEQGDTVVIRSKSIIGGGILGAIMLIFCIAIFFVLKEAWDQFIFWLIYTFIFLSTLYSFVNTVFGKIILNSPKRLMTVYGPFKTEHRFSDINYIDMKSSKPRERYITHTVTVYIGEGKRCVNIDTLSLEQAEELVKLLRGMLDNAAMEYPEGNEESFDLSDDENDVISKVVKSIIAFFENISKKLSKKSEEKKSDGHVEREESTGTDEQNIKTEVISEVTEREKKTEESVGFINRENNIEALTFRPELYEANDADDENVEQVEQTKEHDEAENNGFYRFDNL